MLGFTGALFVSPIAHAASDQLTPIVITPSSGCGLLTSYTAGTVWPATSGPAPSCGRGFHAGVQPGEHTSAADFLAALGRRVAHCWRGPQAACPKEQGRGTRSPPRRESPSAMSTTTATVAEHRRRTRMDRVHLLERRHCPSASERDGSRCGCVRSAEHYLLGDRAALCAVGLRVAGKIQVDQIAVDATEAQGPNITPAADPAVSGTRPEQAGGSGMRQATLVRPCCRNGFVGRM